MNRRDANIHRKVSNARAHDHHFAPENARPTQCSCALSWLMALAPTGRERVLGVKLVEREPLPEGVVERYSWAYAPPVE